MNARNTVRTQFETIRTWLTKIDRRFVLVLLILLVIPLFRPDLFSHIDNKFFTNLYKGWTAVSGVVSIILFVIMGRKGSFAYLAVLTVLSVLVSTIIFGGSVNRWVVYWMPAAIMALLVAATYEIFYRELLIAVFVVVTVMEVANFASVLIFPEGLWATERVAQSGNYFFDHRNNAYKLLFPMILCSMLLDNLAGKKITVRTVLVVILSFAQLIVAPSATSTVALVLFIAFLMLVRWRSCRGLINGITLFAASIAASLLVVGLRVQNLFGFFVVDILHKNLTLTGRTAVWDKVFEMCHGLRHVLFGYGISGYKNIVINGRPYSHAHNEFLDMWLNGGIVGLVILLLLLIFLAIALFKVSKTYVGSILAVAVGAYYVIGLTEPIISVSFMFVAGMAFYSSLHLSGNKVCARQS